MKIFGREPAFYVGLVEAVLMLLLSWNAFGITIEVEGSIVAVVTAAFGFYTAYVTKDTLLGVGVGLVKSLIALYVVFGFNLSENQSAAIIALAVFLLGSFQRTQTTPLVKPTLHTGWVVDGQRAA